MERNEPNRRLKAAIGNNGGGGNQLPPQKCPRCESMNTKFCYFNNYSLSQPRYFCKTCRRYWTQGGTLRNVPVGGSSRRGKRLKTSAAAPPPQLSLAPNSGANFDNPKELNPNLMNSLYPAGGFLSSLAAIQNLGNSAVAPPQLPPVNQLDFGGNSSANLSFSNGFNGQQRQFYQNWQPFSNTMTTSVANSATATTTGSVGSFPMNPNEDQWNDLSNFSDCPP